MAGKTRKSTKSKAPAAKAAPVGGGVRGRMEAFWWAVLSGVLVFTTFPFRAVPDSGIWPLGWVALVPLLWALRGRSAKGAFWIGWLTGAVTNFGGFWWIEHVLREFGHLPPAVAWGLSGASAVYQGLQFALFAWLMVRTSPVRTDGGVGYDGWTPVRVAVLFTAVEFVFPMIFPWYYGASQTGLLAAMQIAEVTGASGVTFVMVLANGAIFYALARSWRSPRVWAAAAVVAGVLAYGGVRLAQVDGSSSEDRYLKVGVVEANIGIWEKEARGLEPGQHRGTLHGNLLKHQAMSQALVQQGAELIIWPESSYIPLGGIYGKRQAASAVATTNDGRLVYLRDTGSGVPRWELSDAAPTPQRWLAAASGREDAWVAVGQSGAVLAGPEGAVVPYQSGAPAGDLTAAAIVAERGFVRQDAMPWHLWAVGPKGVVTGNAQGIRTLEGSPPFPLHGVASIRGGAAYAVGDGGVVLLDQKGVRALPQAVPTGTGLRAVTAGDAGDVWAVGADSSGQGVVYRATRRAWIAETLPSTGTLTAIDANQGQAVAGGQAGVVVSRRTGGTWVREALPSQETVRAVAADAAGGWWAITESGALFERVTTQGSAAWQPVELAGVPPLTGLAGLPFSRMMPAPRDLHQVWVSEVPLPDINAYQAAPAAELALPERERNAVQRGFRAPVLFGGISWEPKALSMKRQGHPTQQDIRRFNTAMLLDANGRVAGTTDKNHLLVFGEYIPLGERFPILYEWIPESGAFTPGQGVSLLEMTHPSDGQPVPVGLVICYEDILPRFTRQVALKQPQLLVNLTNDAWFGKTAEPYHHLGLAVLRAIEHRVALIRSTNTGVSAVIDPAGRLMAQTGLEDAETMLVDVPLQTAGTLYTRLGDAFAYAMLVWTALIWWRRRPA